MSETSSIRTAPPGAYPAGACRDSVTAFLDARTKCQEVGTVLGHLTSVESVEAARASDSLLALNAAREGKDPGAVGNPAQTDLAERTAAARRSLDAWQRMMMDAWSVAAREISAAAPAAVDHWREQRDVRALAVTVAAEALREAQRQWGNAASATAYWTRAARNAGADYGGYLVGRRPDAR